MFGSHRRFKLHKVILSLFMGLVLAWGLTGCNQTSGSPPSQSGFSGLVGSSSTLLNNPSRQTSIPQTKRLSEVSPPEVIQQLRHYLDRYQPQVTILSPRPDQIVEDNRVSVKLKVKDLPTFKDSQWGLGPHLHVFLDNQPYQAIYNLDEPITFTDLEPGTHTLRVFASRPWHESFKNDGAYAQTTFHIFTKSEDNHPDPNLPLLTYSRPSGVYGAEPIMLDFYLTNAPLHIVARENKQDEIVDWRIRVTINGESFIVDQWQPIYLKGFQPGKNWVKLEFLDEQGNVIKNVFNSTVRSITYEPEGQDTLSKLVRGELTVAEVGSIVDSHYQAKPTPEPVMEESPKPTPEPVTKESPKPTPELVTEESPKPTPEPVTEESPKSTPELVTEESPEPVIDKTQESLSESVQETPTQTPVESKPTPEDESQPLEKMTEVPNNLKEKESPMGEKPDLKTEIQPQSPDTNSDKSSPQVTDFFNKAKEVKVGDWINLDKIKQIKVGDWFNNTRQKLSDVIAPSSSQSSMTPAGEKTSFSEEKK